MILVHKHIQRLLKWMMTFGGIYFLFDGALHFLNIRLISVSQSWPDASIIYTKLINQIYGSFAFLVAAWALILQRNIAKYRPFVVAFGIWSAFHGFLLILFGLNTKFEVLFATTPSLFIWLPFYSKYLIFEGILLLVFAMVVFLWTKDQS